MKALVIGYGSIGQRHARLLTEMGVLVAVMSRRSIEFPHCYADLSEALIQWQPDYVVVASRTSEHYSILEALNKQGFLGSVLVEKPLFDRYSVLPKYEFSLVAVAYNLRCHPLLQKLKKFLDNESGIVSASIYTGSYLPSWRSNTDYRQSYSASKQDGGGVLRDLSHEIDYALWLFGKWHRMTAMGGHFSPLDIDSDDVYSLLMETERCPLVSIHMNYLDRMPHREILVNTNNHTVRVDLIRNIMEIDGTQESITVARDDTYLSEHNSMLFGDAEGLCTIAEAMEILLTIESAESAAMSHSWIKK
jgi:predicted dehydrogenase